MNVTDGSKNFPFRARDPARPRPACGGVYVRIKRVFCFAHLGRQGQDIRDHRRDAVGGSSLQEGRPPNVVVVVVVVARRVQVAETARQRRRFVQAQRNTVTR